MKVISSKPLLIAKLSNTHCFYTHLSSAKYQKLTYYCYVQCENIKILITFNLPAKLLVYLEIVFLTLFFIMKDNKGYFI